MARLDELIAFNQKTAPVQPDARSASVEARRSLCIVTCVDPRLTRFFSTVLGIERGDAVVVRLPGANLIGAHADALRAVAAVVYINQATEILILGHTDCGTTRIDSSAITSRMQAAGLNPQSMPGGPREFMGGVGDIRQALKASAAAARAAPFLPRSLLVHCAILDIQTGVLEVLERGEDAQVASAVTDSLTYRPGASGLPANPLGDGLLSLTSSTYSLLSGAGALATATDPMATPASLTSSLPPGWADGAASLAPAAIAASSNALDAMGQGAAMAAPTTSTIDLGFKAVDLAPGVNLTSLGGAPTPARPKTAATHTHEAHSHPPPMPAAKKKERPRAREADVEVAAQPTRGRDRAAQANFEKVRDFYRIEFPLERRKQVARGLANALNAGQTTDHLIKLILKPILDSGQRRYKVIDEMIAVKSTVASMSPEDAYAALSQLLE